MILLLLPLCSFSQNKETLISAIYGITEDGTGIFLKGNHPILPKYEVQASLYYSFTNEYYQTFKVPYKIMSLNVGASRYIYESMNRKLNFKGGLGLLVGQEITDVSAELKNYLNNTLTSISSKPEIVYGGFLNLEANYYLSNYFSLSLMGNEFIHINSKLGRYAPFLGLGLTYHIF